uniref:Uncharacterized protein n=1 Tax=Arundo donax TaxID=35708 RepID=A0A0A9A4Q8_ARUDO
MFILPAQMGGELQLPARLVFV